MMVASLFIVILVCSALWQIVSRYVLGSPSIITEELSRFLLIWAAMLGAAYAFGSKEQLAIVFLKSKLTGVKRKAVDVFIDFSVIIFAGAVLVKGGYSLVTQTITQTSAILEIPMGYVYAILPLTGVLIIVYQLLNVLERHGQHHSSGEEINTPKQTRISKS